MWTALAHLLDQWSLVYADSAVVRTVIGFAHVGGLLVGGGYALSEDRRILSALRAAPSARPPGTTAHGIVLAGLGVVLASGALLFAANAGFYGRSPIFWMKMALVTALIGNGWVLKRALADTRTTSGAGGRLRRAAILSSVLWLLITLAGSALPNV